MTKFNIIINDEISRTSQGTKKLEGNEIERRIKIELEKIASPNYNFTINSHEGIDIFAKNGKRYNLEIKSVKEMSIYKNKKGEISLRKGRFYLKKGDWLNSDIFIFVIKKVNEDNIWTGEIDTHYIDSNEIRKFIKKKGLFEKEFFKLNIKDIELFNDLDIQKIFAK